MTDQIILGLWPIAGITTVGVTAEDARSTIQTAIQSGIRAFDTAFSYGFDGESDRFLGQAIHQDRDSYRVFGKVGQRWTSDRKRVVDGRPAQLVADAEASLSRLQTENFDLLFLHSPDPNTPIAESAMAMQSLKDRGLCKRIGICNVDAAMLHDFCDACQCDAIQAPLNLLQTASLTKLIPTATEKGCETYVFWALMKGLLAGSISRDHVFAAGDSRPTYDIFRGAARERAHRVIDSLREVGRACDRSVAQLSIGWALSQPGVTGALVGARRPQQVREISRAEGLETSTLNQIDAILASIA